MKFLPFIFKITFSLTEIDDAYFVAIFTVNSKLLSLIKDPNSIPGETIVPSFTLTLIVEPLNGAYM